MTTSKIGRAVGVLFSFGLLGSACGGTTTTKPIDVTVCPPGTGRCEGDDLKRCNQAGDRETIELTCAPGRCRAQGDDASCIVPLTPSPITPAACTANQALCDGNIATHCKVDGSGLQPGGVDCAASKQHCLNGACSDTLCIGGTKSCRNGDVSLCSADGSSFSVLRDCTDSERCDEVSGTCLARQCEPSKGDCIGTRAVTCNASGSDWLPDSTDCAAAGKICVAGSCEKKACAASTTFCQDGNVYQCDPSGASSALSRACRPGLEHCELTPAGLYAFCIPYPCVAGQKLCDGDVVKTCNADQTVPQDGTACAKDQICEDGACKSLGCQLGTVFCKGKDIYYCARSEQQLTEPCDPGQACAMLITDPDSDATGNSELTLCMPVSCPAGETGCVQNKIGTCGADGASLSAVTSDCAANGKICTSSGTCEISVTDTVGLAKDVMAPSVSEYVGNVINVRSPRKLTELQAWLAFASAHDIHWMVFELVGSEFVPRAEKTTSVTSSTGFISSGPLSFSYQLEAGKRYALGFFLPSNAVGYYHMETPLPRAESPSFGSLDGMALAETEFSSFNITDSFSPGTVAYMKLTTTAP